MRETIQPHGPVQDTMLRALAVLRFIVLLNTVGLYLVRYRGYDHPAVGAVVMAVLVVWTGLVVWAYDAPRRRGPWLLTADLLVALVAIGLSPYVKGASMNATLPGFWVMGVVIAWAVLWRTPGGLAAAAAVSAADLAIRTDFTQKAYGNIFLLLLGGLIIGFLSALMQRMAHERDQAQLAAATAAERQRLARVVHDGVLQALALVQRRAPELGPDGAELGRLAGEQETQLRLLVQEESRAPRAPEGELDLVSLLNRVQTTRVHVSTPGEAALLSANAARELVAAVEAALSNVRHHVGQDAEAWVLLEDLGDRWVVSVRDAGQGIPSGRLEESAEEGRLGVSQSILGRLADLGGTAELTTAPGRGTEWELGLPKERS
ncbi:MAG: DUF5931 domain-containing protein [Marmoricola sp.]